MHKRTSPHSIILFVLLAAVLPSAACGQVTVGSGRAASETRPVEGFLSVAGHDSVDVRVHVGDSFRVVVHADDNLLPLIHTDVRDATLHVETEPNRGVRFDSPAFVEITMPSIETASTDGSGELTVDGLEDEGEAFTATGRGSGDITLRGSTRQMTVRTFGSGEVTMTGVAADAVTIELRGSGDATLNGRATRLSVATSGSGSVNARALHADEVSATTNGSGDVTVHASRSVTAATNGSGDVTVHGAPRQRSQTANGSGDVRFAG